MHLQKLQSKQNTVLRLKFFATTSGPHTESALPFLNLLDILTVDNLPPACFKIYAYVA